MNEIQVCNFLQKILQILTMICRIFVVNSYMKVAGTLLCLLFGFFPLAVCIYQEETCQCSHDVQCQGYI